MHFLHQLVLYVVVSAFVERVGGACRGGAGPAVLKVYILCCCASWAEQVLDLYSGTDVPSPSGTFSQQVSCKMYLLSLVQVTEKAYRRMYVLYEL